VSPERDSSVIVSVDDRQLKLTRLEKVLFPEAGFTKGELIDYYTRIAPVMLPHVRERPLTMKRYPNGVEGQSFFEKNRPSHAPDWVHHRVVPSPASDGGEVDYTVVCDLPTIVWAANLATIEFHVPLWHIGTRHRLPAPPDHMVFDLDPGEGTSIVDCCRAARMIADELGTRHLATWPKTSGSKGLHLYAETPGARPTWESIRKLAHDIAQGLEAARPDLVVSNMRRGLREGKVLIDWSQNHPAKTTVAAYSVRARPEPTVSTPVTWDEVDDCLQSGDPARLHFTTDEVLRRVDGQGDLFEELGVSGTKGR
jgi:bifunctional non-homologous end joining protein LigD